MRGSPGTKERNDDGKTDRDLRGRDGDDEKDEDLRVVIGKAVCIDAKARERDERQVCRVQHQLERHENDDEIAPQNDAGESRS